MKKKKESKERKKINKTTKRLEKNSNKKVFILLIILVIIVSIILYLTLRNINSDISKIKYVTFESNNIQYKKEYTTKENGTKYLLFTIKGINECGEDVEFIKKEIDDNGDLKLYFDFKYSCGVCAPYDRTFEIPIDNENINNVQAYYRVVSREKCDSNISYKPIIYIYPDKEMDLTIKLKNDKLLTHTYPKYSGSWNIHVDTDGNIYDYKTNKNYYALYWEAFDNSEINMNEGFVIEGKDTVSFLEEKLKYLGLNDREINEFIIYWIDKLENNKYNYIRFRCTEEVNNYMPLEFSEKPDTLIRIIMDYKPLNEKINVKEQELKSTIRNGFTIVEWGGRKLN